MAYKKTEWIDNVTPINAEKLNKIENGIYETEESIPTKTSQLINDSKYIDASKVKNNLTETVEGNVLDATMGKALKEDIDDRALKTEVGTLSGLATTVRTSIVAAVNEVLGYIGKLQSLVTNAKTSLVDAINENTNEINDLSNTKSEYIGKAFISEEILLDATYPIAYCGSVGNSSTMPNTGQFRVQYIPYFANNEGYSVQIAWGVVTNSGLWYRVASGTRWEKWESFSTTTKTDILVTPTNGLKVTGNNVSFVEEIAGIKIYHGELEAAAPISDNPIVLTLPKFTSNTWRPVTFVKQDTKEAYGGWCYHGGQVRASLPAGKYNIDIIYT